MIELVNKYGPKKWSTIAQHLPGRIGKQCRERYGYWIGFLLIFHISLEYLLLTFFFLFGLFILMALLSREYLIR